MTNAEARFNNSLRLRKPEGSLGRTAQDSHLDSHTAPELSAGHLDSTCGGVMYPVVTRMPGESYRRRLGSLLFCSCDDFGALLCCLPCVLIQ